MWKENESVEGNTQRIGMKVRRKRRMRVTKGGGERRVNKNQKGRKKKMWKENERAEGKKRKTEMKGRRKKRRERNEKGESKKSELWDD